MLVSIYRWWIVICFLPIFVCCDGNIPQHKTDEMVYMTMKLYTTHINQAVSRAEKEGVSGSAFENTINDIQVLVFKVRDDIEYFDYIAPQNKSTLNGQQVITIALKPSTEKQEKYSLVVMANVGDIGNIVDKFNPSFTTKEEALNEFTFTVSKTQIERSWKEDNQTIYLPMWGYREPSVITPEVDENGITQILDEEMQLLRSVARVDVGIKKEIENFELTDIHIFNCVNKGLVAPNKNADLAEVIYTNLNNFQGIMVNNPSLPAEINRLPRVDFTYIQSEETTDGVSLMKRTIYLPEAPKSTKNTPCASDATCLVVGGFYNQTTKKCYYRIDFATFENGKVNQETPTTYWDLLRNHCYVVIINEVNGAGTATPEEALTNYIPLKATVEPWSLYETKYDLTINIPPKEAPTDW